jgi:hypothetical protein
MGALRKRCRTLSLEALERRELLAVISWTNRGGAVDSDDFGATYGANANIARAIVDRAINDWERVIANFNYQGPFGGAGEPVAPNTFELTVNALDLGDSGRGRANTLRADDQGRMYSANIDMDDDGGGAGWFFAAG